MKQNKRVEEINNILCPLCSSRLIFKYINQKKKIFLCSNAQCIFPMDQFDMDKFIIQTNEDNLNEFISNIKKIIFEQSLSNDTNFEENFKKSNKDEPKIDTKNLDYSDILSSNDRQPFFDSFSEKDNFDFE